VIPVFTWVPNTPYYSVDGSNFSPTIGTLAVGNHTVIVADYNAGTFSCASAPFNFTINTVAPTGTSPQSLPSTDTLADIVVTGSGIIWYASAADASTATNPLPNSTVVTNNTTYYATQTIGGCASTTSLPVLVQTFLGLNEFDANAFKYYPNPVENIMTISYLNNIKNIVVYNIIGKQVLAKNVDNKKAEIDMSNLSEGVYFMKVYSEKGSIVIKIIKD